VITGLSLLLPPSQSPPKSLFPSATEYRGMSYQRLFGAGGPAGDDSGSNSDALPDLLPLSSSSDCDGPSELETDLDSDGPPPLLRTPSSGDSDSDPAPAVPPPRSRRPPSRFDLAAPAKVSQLENNVAGASSSGELVSARKSQLHPTWVPSINAAHLPPPPP
jgi:hypothetical protein